MARIFLSHSSRDNASAGALKAWLDEQGFAAAFLDFDTTSGIPPGADGSERCIANSSAARPL